MATARPMPLLAPVTRAFWPLSILRASHRGMCIAGNCSGITSRTDLLSRIMTTEMKRSEDRLHGDSLAGSLSCYRRWLGPAAAQQVNDQACPARLMARSHSSAGIAMEVLVEEHVVPEVRVAE